MSDIGPYKQPSDTSVTVNGTSSQIVAKNMGRIRLSITNVGIATVWLGVGQTAVLNTGDSIPAGGKIEYEIKHDFDQWACNVINGITDGTSVVLGISEVTR